MSQELTSAADTERTSTRQAPGVTADDQAEIDFWTAALEEHSNRAMLNISRQALAKLLGIIGKLRTEQRAPQLDLGERETWLTVEQEVNRDLVGSLQILERFTGTAEEKRFHAKKVRGLFARLVASRSVISSASPLSEEERKRLANVRARLTANGEGRIKLHLSRPIPDADVALIQNCYGDLDFALALIDRLSASAPSPEDAKPTHRRFRLHLRALREVARRRMRSERHRRR
jgi:hypothetical protein